MAITLDITGVLQAAAFWVSNKGGSNGWKLFIYFYIMLTVLSIVLGNDPVICMFFNSLSEPYSSEPQPFSIWLGRQLVHPEIILTLHIGTVFLVYYTRVNEVSPMESNPHGI